MLIQTSQLFGSVNQVQRYEKMLLVGLSMPMFLSMEKESGHLKQSVQMP